jgi:hypothetical protein
MAMPTKTRVGHGTDHLAQEVKDEAARLISHPIEEVKRLEHVVAEGESAATPLVATIGVAAALLLILAVVTAVILTVYYTA